MNTTKKLQALMNEAGKSPSSEFLKVKRMAENLIFRLFGTVDDKYIFHIDEEPDSVSGKYEMRLIFKNIGKELNIDTRLLKNIQANLNNSSFTLYLDKKGFLRLDAFIDRRVL